MNSPVEQIKNEKRQLLKKLVTENISKNKTFFHGNKDALLVFDLDGHIVQVNSTFENVFEYSSEESLQMKLQMLFPLESLDLVFHFFHKASLGEYQNFDSVMTCKKGQDIDVNITNIPLFVDDKVIGVYSVAKDITHLKKKKSELRNIEEFHKVITDHAGDIILCTNMPGKILYVSPSCEYILGFRPDELLGKHYMMLFQNIDKKKALLDYEAVITRHEKGRGSYRFRKKDGSFIWMESLSNPIVDPDTRNIIEVISVIRDITERKQAEDELWSRKRAFRELVEHSPDAVIIAKNEEILFINETGVSLLGGNQASEFMSKSLLDLICKEYHQEAKERINIVVEGETTDFKLYKMLRLDGSAFEAEIKGIPTFFQNQAAQHVIIRDITERKKTQQLILNSEKLTIAGQLAAGIAHEVRNPLTAIKGFLQLMESQTNNKSYFEIIQSEMERIELILSELLVLAKPQDLKFEIVNIHSLLKDVKTLIDTTAIMNNILIEVNNECKELTIRCDKNQLKQVFINFLKNSIEALPSGGNILIDIKKYNQDKIKIIFKDTGVGIPYHILKRLGEPFFTTKEDGTGLGIMISKQIIENHNGNIHFWSDDKGTMIEVILPINI